MCPQMTAGMPGSSGSKVSETTPSTMLAMANGLVGGIAAAR